MLHSIKNEFRYKHSNIHDLHFQLPPSGNYVFELVDGLFRSLKLINLEKQINFIQGNLYDVLTLSGGI